MAGSGKPPARGRLFAGSARSKPGANVPPLQKKYNIGAALGPLLGSFRDWAETPEEWLYTVLPCALIALFRCPPFRCVPRETNGGGVGPHMPVFKSAFLPCHRVKMDIPKPRGILEAQGSNSISRAPLSIRALHSTRNERIRQDRIFVRKPIADFPVRAALSRAWSRMTGGGNSLKI